MNILRVMSEMKFLSFLRNRIIEPKSGCTRKYLSCTDCDLFVKGACLDADVED